MHAGKRDVGGILTLRDRERMMLIAATRQVLVAAESVREDDRAGGAGVSDEIEQRLRLHIRDHLHPGLPQDCPLVIRAPGRALDRDTDDQLAFGPTATLAAWLGTARMCAGTRWRVGLPPTLILVEGD